MHVKAIFKIKVWVIGQTARDQQYKISHFFNVSNKSSKFIIVHAHLGKLVMDMSTSSGFSKALASSLLSLIFVSTTLKNDSSPPYGFPGVPSIMYAAYSGLHNDFTVLKS